MPEDYVQTRVKEIYDAYERKGRTKNYNITLTPINGSGDIDVVLNRINGYGHSHERQLTIKREDSLDFIGQEGRLHGD